MKIKSISYSQYDESSRKWSLSDLTLNSVNLVVRRNASGKTKILNLVNSLARLLAGETKLVYVSGNWDVAFEHEGKLLRYVLQYDDAKVKNEQFVFDGKEYLFRGEGGFGKLFAMKQGALVEFQAPEDELAAVVRRDSLQHPFFEPLHEWGKSVLHFSFGRALGKDNFAVIAKNALQEVNPKDTEAVVAIYRKAESEFTDEFKRMVKDDMASLDYEIEDVGTKSPVSIVINTPFAGQLVGLYVKEKTLPDITDQFEMSQGMFRVLSLIVQLNYAVLSQKPRCILIDDVGEGLDFERACALIDTLMRKAKEFPVVQLIMATNDRFVMNRVPLSTWSVLHRDGGSVRVFNYQNSKKRFDEFKFTGLNNFDFFATDFVKEGENPREQAGRVR